MAYTVRKQSPRTWGVYQGRELVSGVFFAQAFAEEEAARLNAAPAREAEPFDPRVNGYNVEFLGAQPARAGEDY